MSGRFAAHSLCPRQNSNLQPFAPQANALSNCATRADLRQRKEYTPFEGIRQVLPNGLQLVR